MVRAARHGFTRCAAVSCCHGVGGHEAAAAAGGQRSGICIAIGLAARVRRPGCVFLVDGIRDRRGGDIVIVGGACEAPGVIVGVCHDVCRAAHVNRTDSGPCLAIHTRDRSYRCRVRLAVIGHRVGRNHHRGIGLRNIGRGRRYRVQHIVASIGPAQARTRQCHSLAVAHVLVAEGSCARSERDNVRD